MNHNKFPHLSTFTCIAVIAVISLLAACTPSSGGAKNNDRTSAPASDSPSIGQGLHVAATIALQAKGIPESEYVAFLFLRGCGEQANSSANPYLNSLQDFQFIMVMTEACDGDIQHQEYLRSNLPLDRLAMLGYTLPEQDERFYIDGQTTLYVGKGGMISYIHKAGEPFPFTSKDELIAHIESHSN